MVQRLPLLVKMESLPKGDRWRAEASSWRRWAAVRLICKGEDEIDLWLREEIAGAVPWVARGGEKKIKIKKMGGSAERGNGRGLASVCCRLRDEGDSKAEVGTGGFVAGC